MEIPQPKLAPVKIMPTGARTNSGLVRFASHRLKVLWRFVVSRAGSKRKALLVRETAALGERRFVSVIQFERQRFLVGSSASTVTLLAQLPDEPQSGEKCGGKSGDECEEE